MPAACLTSLMTGRQQVRDAVVERQFDALGVDHHELDLARRGAVEQAGDDDVQADALAGVGRAADQQVRHPGQVGVLVFAGHVLAEREGQLATARS